MNQWLDSYSSTWRFVTIDKEKPMIEQTHYIVKRTNLGTATADNPNTRYCTIEEAETSARAILAKQPASASSFTIYKAVEIVRTATPPVEVVHLVGSF